ncbi:unnamed protein product [Rhizoctonia solani]|uniref:Uncharacterized protein n=1 Tax=Rhizoctonia solani TaxID=456999 RepID=A0A8H3GTR6_9AGAM|nr:unnamed protein product [Rhizoctonia solani]
MSCQRYKTNQDTGRPCKTCRNKGRMCNKCWSFSIGGSSAAAPTNLKTGLGISSNDLDLVKPRETRSYRRILPRTSTTSSLESDTPRGNPPTKSDPPLGERQLVRNSAPIEQEYDRDTDQNTTLHAKSGTSNSSRIHILIPPMDELGKAVQFIVIQHDRFVSQLALFKPRNTRFCLDAKRTATQLQNSQVMHWLLFLMCIIYRELLDGNERIYKRHHISWVDRFEQRIATRMAVVMGPVTPADSRNQLTGHIEVSLLKHEVTETIAESYACLQSCSMSFLQIAFSEPTLWSVDNAYISIPLARALSSTRGEINRFACTDVMAALALGLPTLVAYDTSSDGLDTLSFHAMEYVHGCPTEFLITLVEIHNWGLQNPEGTCDQGQWQAIEERITKLRQVSDETDARAADSTQTIIRFAVRESWRHATLIYLYLVMCGARSDDPRIQSSVRQVIKLIDNIRPDTSYTTFFFLQYLFAGICAQKEQHRHCIMARFLTPIHMNWGLLRISQFAKVLDHLWHGAATNGRGVIWKDYLESRVAVIPIHL